MEQSISVSLNHKIALEQDPFPCFVLDLDGYVIFSNSLARRLLVHENMLHPKIHFISMIKEDDTIEALNNFKKVISGEQRIFSLSLKQRNNSYIKVSLIAFPYRVAGGIKGVSGYLLEEYPKFDRLNVIESKDVCISHLDPTSKKIVHITQDCLDIFGYTQEEFLKHPNIWEEAIHPLDRKNVLSFYDNLTQDKAIYLEYRILDRKGNTKWISDNIIPKMDVPNHGPYQIDRIFNDITKRKEKEEKLLFLAYHDLLTELPNRWTLETKLFKAMVDAKESAMSIAIFYLNLDRFKIINDTLGRKMGDLLLRIIAKRLRACLSDDDIIARQGGDEFIILRKNISNIDSIAKEIHAEISKPIHLKDKEYVISASLGVSIFPDDSTDGEVLIKSADQAMYYAKESGTGIQFFNKSLIKDFTRRMTIEQDLFKAIDSNELYLEYQPIVNVYKRQVIGLEALLRWNHPDYGPVPPAEFIEIAEESDLIIKINDWVIDQVCRHLKNLEKKNLRTCYVSINISGRHIQNDTFIDSIKESITRYGIAPSMLIVEITERIAMKDVNRTIKVIQELRDFGVEFFIDDFGTGYSSLKYLVDFPIKAIKIDKSFTQGLRNKKQKAICRALVTIGRNLGLDVVAEGVEDQEQYQYLCSIGANKMQGYYFSRPVSYNKIETFFPK